MADNASLDQNRNKTLQAVSTVNNSSPVNLQADPNTHALKVGGSINISNALITGPFDYICVTYPDTSTEVYTYKLGGASGTLVGTVTVLYSDAITKNILLSVTKS